MFIGEIEVRNFKWIVLINGKVDVWLFILKGIKY